MSDTLPNREGTEDDFRRRRERAKISQRAYRQRQNQISKNRDEEIQRLKDAIRGVVEAGRHDTAPDLQLAISKAAEVAGMEIGLADVQAAPQKDRPTNLNPNALNVPNGTEVQSVAHTLRGMISPEETPSPAPQCFSGRMSPRLDYGLWIDDHKSVRLVDPPAEIVPFLGQGMHSLAGQIFWNSAAHFIDLCHRAQELDVGTSSSQGKPWTHRHTPEALAARHDICQRIWHSRPLHDAQYLRGMAEARMSFRTQGYYLAPDAVSASVGSPDSGIEMNRLVEADYESRGEDHGPGTWLSPTGVADHVRDRIGTRAFERLERVLQLQYQQGQGQYQQQVPVHKRGQGLNETWMQQVCGHVQAGNLPQLSPDHPFAEACALLNVLISNLAHTYICFGDGPRWSTSLVSELFKGMA